MNTRLLRRRPTSRINTRRNLSRIVLLSPLNEQSNRILGLRHTSQFHSCSLRCRSRHLNRDIVGRHALADINMVRVQIIGDITVLPGPRLERLELRLRLAHITVEVIEVAKRSCFRARVRVCGIEALVVFHEDEYPMFPSFLDER